LWLAAEHGVEVGKAGFGAFRLQLGEMARGQPLVMHGGSGGDPVGERLQRHLPCHNLKKG